MMVESAVIHLAHDVVGAAADYVAAWKSLSLAFKAYETPATWSAAKATSIRF